MPFRESKFEMEIEKGETEEEKIELSLDKEIEEKYPAVYKMLKERIELLKRSTTEIKEKYPELEELNDYAKKSGFKEVLITKKELIESKIFLPFISAIPPYIIFPENYFSPLRELKSFAPDFFARGIKNIFGVQGEKISGHEQQHFRGPAFQTEKQKYAILERVLKEIEEIEESLKKGDLIKFIELQQGLSKKKFVELMKLQKANEIQTEVQRIFNDSKNEEEVIENVSIIHVFNGLLHYGIEKGLVSKLDFKKSYPFLKERILEKIVKREKEIKRDLKERYEKWK